ncbi:peptidoglycan-binding domain-containing protein [Yinghuangia soli]|uniref:Peptidoglycan-binding protein n=1 Tax=Yinghuangia soli TaxID=2908204 RepID=A0AA41U458_9ACTN|nr:peptidoglycan-binding domain-containing protein [Yinghuangia soli]MCF2532501.1 peptidoglycan-binding protein [Yinghuangia soli]
MPKITAKVTMVLSSTALAFAGLTAAAPAASAESLCNYISDSARPTVYVNQDGTATKQVQCLINWYSGYPPIIAVDGDYGPATYTAIKWVQNCHNLVDDGIVGNQTWAKLYSPWARCASS